MSQAPIGIYLHVPFCAKKCPYCDFYSLPYTYPKVKAYTDAVCRNLKARKGTAADSVFLGGGTPSLLPDRCLSELMAAVKNDLVLTEAAEITLEVNPNTVTPKRLQAWRAMGINRLSFGVQSFCDPELSVLGRKHTAAQAKAAIAAAASEGFRNVSCDLMLGIPNQTADSLKCTLTQAAALPLTHVSAYLLKLEAGTPFGQGAYSGTLPNDDQAAELYLLAVELLEASGFLQYEISNFAKSGFESRHNLKYWQCEPYWGIGPAAHSCLDGKRLAVPPDLELFLNSPIQKEQVTAEQAPDLEERLMLGLRLRRGIRQELFPDSWQKLCQRALPLIQAGYLQTDSDQTTLALTPKGFLVSNAVIGKLLEAI